MYGVVVHIVDGSVHGCDVYDVVNAMVVCVGGSVND